MTVEPTSINAPMIECSMAMGASRRRRNVSKPRMGTGTRMCLRVHAEATRTISNAVPCAPPRVQPANRLWNLRGNAKAVLGVASAKRAFYETSTADASRKKNAHRTGYHELATSSDAPNRLVTTRLQNCCAINRITSARIGYRRSCTARTEAFSMPRNAFVGRWKSFHSVNSTAVTRKPSPCTLSDAAASIGGAGMVGRRRNPAMSVDISIPTMISAISEKKWPLAKDEAISSSCLQNLWVREPPRQHRQPPKSQ